jgi:hypothetical protein
VINVMLKEIIKQIEKAKEDTREQTGSFKYYECLEIIKKYV